MIVIRRMVDRRRAYTAIFLKGEPPKIFPTSDAEHARILQVYKQDRPHEGILNDFSEEVFPSVKQAPVPSPSKKKPGVRTKAAARSKGKILKKKRLGKAGTKGRAGKGFRGPLWVVVVE